MVLCTVVCVHLVLHYAHTASGAAVSEGRRSIAPLQPPHPTPTTPPPPHWYPTPEGGGGTGEERGRGMGETQDTSSPTVFPTSSRLYSSTSTGSVHTSPETVHTSSQTVQASPEGVYTSRVPSRRNANALTRTSANTTVSPLQTIQHHLAPQEVPPLQTIHYHLAPQETGSHNTSPPPLHHLISPTRPRTREESKQISAPSSPTEHLDSHTPTIFVATGTKTREENGPTVEIPHISGISDPLRAESEPTPTPQMGKQPRVLDRERQDVTEKNPFGGPPDSPSLSLRQSEGAQLARIWSAGEGDQWMAGGRGPPWEWTKGRRRRRKLGFVIVNAPSSPAPPVLTPKPRIPPAAKSITSGGKIPTDGASVSTRDSEARKSSQKSVINISLGPTNDQAGGESLMNTPRALHTRNEPASGDLLGLTSAGDRYDPAQGSTDFEITKTGDFGGFSVTKTEEIDPIKGFKVTRHEGPVPEEGGREREIERKERAEGREERARERAEEREERAREREVMKGDKFGSRVRGENTSKEAGVLDTLGRPPKKIWRAGGQAEWRETREGENRQGKKKKKKKKGGEEDIGRQVNSERLGPAASKENRALGSSNRLEFSPPQTGARANSSSSSTTKAYLNGIHAINSSIAVQTSTKNISKNSQTSWENKSKSSNRTLKSTNHANALNTDVTGSFTDSQLPHNTQESENIYSQELIRMKFMMNPTSKSPSEDQQEINKAKLRTQATTPSSMYNEDLIPPPPYFWETGRRKERVEKQKADERKTDKQSRAASYEEDPDEPPSSEMDPDPGLFPFHFPSQVAVRGRDDDDDGGDDSGSDDSDSGVGYNSKRASNSNGHPGVRKQPHLHRVPLKKIYPIAAPTKMEGLTKGSGALDKRQEHMKLAKDNMGTKHETKRLTKAAARRYENERITKEIAIDSRHGAGDTKPEPQGTTSWPGPGEKVEFITMVPGGSWDVWGGPVLWDSLSSNSTLIGPQVYSVYWGDTGGQGSTTGWPEGVWVLRGGSLVAIISLVLTISVQVTREGPFHKTATTGGTATDVLIRAHQSQHATLATNLATSLASAHVLLIFGIQATGRGWVCGVVGLLLHFLHLVTCCWLLCLTLRLLASLLRRPPLHTAAFCLSAWAASLGLVVVSFVVNPGGYETRRYCWMSVERGMLVSFIVPVCTLILVNAGVCVAVQKLLLDLPEGATSGQRRELRGAVSLLPLQGVAWFMAVVALEDEQSLALDVTAALVSAIMSCLVLYFHGWWWWRCHGLKCCWLTRRLSSSSMSASSRRLDDLTLPLTARHSHHQDPDNQPLLTRSSSVTVGPPVATPSPSAASSPSVGTPSVATPQQPPQAPPQKGGARPEEFPLQPIFPNHVRREVY